MKFAHTRLFFILIISFFISSCSVSVDQDENQVDEFTRQLDAAYSACANNGINDLSSLETVLNTGGNNISKGCRTALSAIDFAGVVSAFDITLGFETPKPREEINPLQDDTSSWQTFSNWSATESLLYISTGLDTTNQTDVYLEGVSSNGTTTELINFTIEEVDVNNIAVSYTTDYSGSMLQADIVAIDGYFQDFHSVLPNSTPASVTIFSEVVTAKTSGFITDATEVNAALNFDADYNRSSTALYDAWGDALNRLDAENKKIAVNILTTDGFENDSTVYLQTTLQQKIIDSNAFNIVIASLWAESSALQNLVAGKGIVIYKYQIDEAQQIASTIKIMLSNVKKIQVNDDVSGYSSLNLGYNNTTKLNIPLP